MKRLLLALLLLPALALAQTSPTPPVVTLPMPAPLQSFTAGQNVQLIWNAVTEATDGSALTGVVYNLWNVTSGTAVLLASGLTSPGSERTDLAVGTPCYVVTASAAGDIDSVGSSPPFCISVTAAPKQVAAPTGVTSGVIP